MGDVFISYSRRNKKFARQIFDALTVSKRETWADWQGIDYSTKWWEEICAGIDGADNFVLLISMDSLNSKYCHQEIERARAKAKRIIPVVYKPIDQAALIGGWYTNPEMKPFEALARENWEALRAIQWIKYPDLGSVEKVVSALLETVDTQPELTHLHTRLTLRIRDWEASGRNPDLLLHGIELVEYEEWLAVYEQSTPAPTPTDEQRVYIKESRRIEDKLRQERETQNLFEALKGQALKQFVEPYLLLRLQELKEKIAQTVGRDDKTFYFSAGAENFALERDTIVNFLDTGGNWHPQPAEYDGWHGEGSDYVVSWKFPCCGKEVFTLDESPLQFRADGCQQAPNNAAKS